ncbi:MAG TPA: YceI family protein [Candidatus Dormibacteraeota bacterium]|jgi:polyisoprenoid-binding protein YceI|nr:YceI family protein [Candidatus Dormibacteraeota bacterium]
MQLSDGTIQLSPQIGTLTLYTKREGFGSSAGHDLTIVATAWSGVARQEDGRISLEVSVDPSGLSVKEGHGGARALTDSDRRDIERNLREKVLETGSNPRIDFRSSEVTTLDDADDRLRLSVSGTLELHGQQQPLKVDVDIHRGDEGLMVLSSATIVQTRWGIRPYRAFMGALKVADAIDVRVVATLPATVITGS